MDPTTFRLLSGAVESIPPVAISFTASNYYPSHGASTTLSWNVTNAASVASSFMGAVGVTGSTTISSAGTVSYTLTVTGLNGLAYSSTLTIYWADAPYCPPTYQAWGWC